MGLANYPLVLDSALLLLEDLVAAKGVVPVRIFWLKFLGPVNYWTTSGFFDQLILWLCDAHVLGLIGNTALLRCADLTHFHEICIAQAFLPTTTICIYDENVPPIHVRQKISSRIPPSTQFFILDGILLEHGN